MVTVSDSASVFSEGIAGSLLSSGFNMDFSNFMNVECHQNDHPQAIIKYFVAEDWGEFVKNRMQGSAQRCQAFVERLPRIAIKLSSKKSEKCEELRATLASLEYAAGSGCPLCSMLLMVLAHY